MTASSVAFQFSKLNWFLFMIMFSKIGVHSLAEEELERGKVKNVTNICFISLKESTPLDVHTYQI